MWQTLFGSINTAFIFISLLGVFSQLRTLWRAKAEHQAQPTKLLSLKMFMVSFLAYFSFYVYGMAITPFNHFIVWPRLIASILVALILYEIWRDRGNRKETLALLGAICLLVVGSLFGLLGDSYTDSGKVIMAGMICIITSLLAYGYYHQIKLVIKAGSTGSLDKNMSLFILMMDVSTIAFACVIGIKNGWPLLLLATVSGITKIIILYLFRWVRISPNAQAKRLAATT
ncbi:hypothetical protein [Neptunicella marina]|uniref:Uncharacterized protein n=1 Tax=Neptunicella marina TaxID=2125989 RepID=A0A8J6M138_9ALTE|nr:hypothetical protein [Neptunicella marina]MBC3765172.1 hypothetical protein [Neptunicella marina]